MLLDVLEKTGARHCVIDGLAVNAYVEPVVSLDLVVEPAFPRMVPGASAAR